MKDLAMEITGMSCGHCVMKVDKTLKGLDGVEVKSVGIGSASIHYDPERVTPSQIADAVADQGYVVVRAA
jgi:copper chaperone